jgi:hypothetical protein
MQLDAILLLAFVFSLLLFFIQRSEKRRRLVAIIVVLGVGELLRRYVFYRDYHDEALIALIIAVILNVLFWLLIGRYNPVGSSDSIQVMGLDD